jgi:hypothetical protein
MQMAEIADEELSEVVPIAVKDIKKEFQDIGYYKDEKGYTRYGIIPKDNTPKAKVSWNLYDGKTVTSNPLYR